MVKEVKPGIVYQKFGDGSYSGPYILKGLPSGSGYWEYKVNLFKMDGSWNHVADIRCLENDISLEREEKLKTLLC